MVLKESWCQFISFNFDHLKYDNYDLEMNNFTNFQTVSIVLGHFGLIYAFM